MSRKKSFVLYFDYIDHVKLLSDQEAGQLFKALFIFGTTGEKPELTGRTELAFSFIANQMTRDLEKWESIREKRTAASRRRWDKYDNNANECKSMQMDANESKCMQMNANGCVNVNVNDNVNADVNESGSVNVNENVNESGNVNDNEINSAETPAPAPGKNKSLLSFGKYSNVRLTKEEYDSLSGEFGEEKIKEYIRKMDEWIQCVGRKPYKDFSIALKRWLESDNVGRKSEQAQETDFDVDKYKIFINNF